MRQLHATWAARTKRLQSTSTGASFSVVVVVLPRSAIASAILREVIQSFAIDQKDVATKLITWDPSSEELYGMQYCRFLSYLVRPSLSPREVTCTGIPLFLRQSRLPWRYLETCVDSGHTQRWLRLNYQLGVRNPFPWLSVVSIVRMVFF